MGMLHHHTPAPVPGTAVSIFSQLIHSDHGARVFMHLTTTFIAQNCEISDRILSEMLR